MAQYIGNDIIGFVTSGLHRNPLVLYREYIQNSADAYAAAGVMTSGKVDVTVDLPGAAITIRDYGPGLDYKQALRSLIPIARSQKRRTIDRGFRGVGRLSGLAFAESIIFQTRAQDEESVTKIVWDGNQLRSHTNNTSNIDELIQRSVTTSQLSARDHPKNFFEVQIRGVARHSAGIILNRKLVRDYICEVCPVPLPSTFKFSSSINAIFGEAHKPLTLHTRVDGIEKPLTRPFSDTMRLSESRVDSFNELEHVCVPSLDGNTVAAIGWIAHSSYLGAIPKVVGLRGLRARAGNIQIGDESVFRHLFPEGRFNNWCVGEIHIVDARIVPNGQRDYFEPGPHVRDLENQLAAVLRGVVGRCRKASTSRHTEKRILSTLSNLEDVYDLAISGYFSAEDTVILIKHTLTSTAKLRNDFLAFPNGASIDLSRLDTLEMNLNNFRYESVDQPFKAMQRTELATYQRVCSAIAKTSQSPGMAKEIIRAVLKDI